MSNPGYKILISEILFLGFVRVVLNADEKIG